MRCIDYSRYCVVLDVNYQPTIKKLLKALQMNGRRYVVDVRQSWSKFDKPCKVYIVNRMYTEEEYKLTFPHKYKKGKTFKQGQLYKKESEYSSTKQHEVLLFLYIENPRIVRGFSKSFSVASSKSYSFRVRLDCGPSTAIKTLKEAI